MRDDIAAYNERNVIVFGVNGGSARSHRSFARRYKAVWGPSFLQVVKRTVVGVDPTGRIVYYRRGTPSTNEILAAI